MEKIKNALLKHFSENNKELFKDIVLTIISYCTPYFELVAVHDTIQLDGYANVLKRLSDDKFAIGYLDGRIKIYTLTKESTILHCVDDMRNYLIPKYSTSVESIHKICDIIFYKIKYVSTLYYLNLKTNEKGFYCLDDYSKIIIPLGPNIIAHSHDNVISIIYNRPYKTYRHMYNYTSCICRLNDNIIISSCEFGNCKIVMTSINDFVDEPSEVKYSLLYKKQDHCYFSVQIIPCKNEENISTKISDNNIIIIKKFYAKDLQTMTRVNNIILVYNVITGKNVIVVKNIIGNITSVVYLNNGYFAILINSKVIIYSIVSKSEVQTINSKDYVFLEVIKNKLIMIDNGSNINVYE